MSNRQTAFVVFYVVCIILTVIFQTDLGVYILLFTFGMGMALFIIAPNVAIYGLPVLAYIALTKDGDNKVLGRIVLTVGLGLVACLPAYLSKELAEQKAAELSGNDLVRPALSAPRHFEIHQSNAQYAKVRSRHKAYCGHLCQKLLVTSSSETVIVRTVSRSHKILDTISYGFEERPSCPGLAGTREMLLPYTKWLERRGKCVVVVPQPLSEDKAIKISLLTADGRQSYIKSIAAGTLGHGLKVRQLEIHAPNGAEPQRLIHRRTETSTTTVSLPIWVKIEGGHDLRFNYAISRNPLVLNSLHIDTLLADQLGLNFAIPDIGE